MKSEKILPLHVAFIMDGNGRWASKRLMPRNFGHKAGVKTMKNIAEIAFDTGIKYLSFYAFSTENWNRPTSEVDGLITLIKDNIVDIAEKMKDKNIRLSFMGDTSAFAGTEDFITRALILTKDCTGGVINIGLNYGGRAEIVSAVNKAVAKGEAVNEVTFSKLLYTACLPDPDLIIRTGGEKRLSNFMLYQAAYSELYFSDTLWPDFGEKEFKKIIEDYGHRNRRFGTIK